MWPRRSIGCRAAGAGECCLYGVRDGVVRSVDTGTARDGQYPGNCDRTRHSSQHRALPRIFDRRLDHERPLRQVPPGHRLLQSGDTDCQAKRSRLAHHHCHGVLNQSNGPSAALSYRSDQAADVHSDATAGHGNVGLGRGQHGSAQTSRVRDVGQTADRTGRDAWVACLRRVGGSGGIPAAQASARRPLRPPLVAASRPAVRTAW